jgi:hypothetical protein
VSNINFDEIQISKLIFENPTVGLRCINPPRHFSQLKAMPIPLIEIGRAFN